MLSFILDKLMKLGNLTFCIPARSHRKAWMSDGVRSPPTAIRFIVNEHYANAVYEGGRQSTREGVLANVWNPEDDRYYYKSTLKGIKCKGASDRT